MYLIKRYSNRKLYDTVRKRYLTLSEIGELVAKGYEVQVIDNDTGADLTSLVLSQVIYEQEKRQKGSLPTDLLSALIQRGSDLLHRLPQSLHRLLWEGGEGLEEMVELWVREGVIQREHKERVKEDILFFWGIPKLEELIRKVLREYDFPSPKDLEKTRRLLCELEAKLDHISGSSPRLQRDRDEGGRRETPSLG